MWANVLGLTLLSLSLWPSQFRARCGNWKYQKQTFLSLSCRLLEGQKTPPGREIQQHPWRPPEGHILSSSLLTCAQFQPMLALPFIGCTFKGRGRAARTMNLWLRVSLSKNSLGTLPPSFWDWDCSSSQEFLELCLIISKSCFRSPNAVGPMGGDFLQ